MLQTGKMLVENSEIIIPRAVLDELQAQASTNRDQGLVGLQEIHEIRDVCNKKGIKINFSGERPDYDDILLAKHGRIDSIINELAFKENAILITGDYVQHLAALAQGIDSVFIKYNNKITHFKFEKFFSDKTMSIHLKEGVYPYAKIGSPGKFELKRLDEKIITNEYLKEIIKEIYEYNPLNTNKFYEINREGATVIQYEKYRITITKSPFSDSTEITIVRPMVHLSLDDYSPYPARAVRRLLERSPLVVGAGGKRVLLRRRRGIGAPLLRGAGRRGARPHAQARPHRRTRVHDREDLLRHGRADEQAEQARVERGDRDDRRAVHVRDGDAEVLADQ